MKNTVKPHIKRKREYIERKKKAIEAVISSTASSILVRKKGEELTNILESVLESAPESIPILKSIPESVPAPAPPAPEK